MAPAKTMSCTLLIPLTSPVHTTTIASTATLADLRVVQLHGFASDAIANVLIVSSGRPDRPPVHTRAPLLAALHLPNEAVALHGVNVHVLGATGNVAARRLTTRSQCRFLHLELSRPLRDHLLDNPDLPAAMMHAVQSTGWTP
jgi:hypothetical protein